MGPEYTALKTLVKREGLHTDYTREHFEESLRARFSVERSEELAGGTRVLYFAQPRR